MPRKKIATWFYSEAPGEGGEYAQVRGESSSEPFRDVYRRCVATYFASAKRTAADAQLILYLNAPWATSTGTARKAAAIMKSLGVEIRILQYTYAPPADWPKAWRNQFFVFDVLADLAASSEPEDSIVVSDSDVIWTGAECSEAMWQDLASAGALFLDLPYPDDTPINGLSRAEASEVARRYLDAPIELPLPYLGGEFLAVTGEAAGRLADSLSKVWPRLLDDFAVGLRVFPEEAHLLSFLVVDLGLPGTGLANPYVKRIWTQAFKYRNAAPADLELALWHLPAEKRYGLRRLFQKLHSDGDAGRWATNGSTWTADVGLAVGVPRIPLLKALRDLSHVAASRLRRRDS